MVQKWYRKKERLVKHEPRKTSLNFSFQSLPINIGTQSDVIYTSSNFIIPLLTDLL